MTLIKTISGFRGTIGGPTGDTLNPLDIVKFVTAYAMQRRESGPKGNLIVVGRDARISGHMVSQVVCGTLRALGFDVLNIGLATTPTTELAVTMSKAVGGLILTASHNPRQWNALKMLDENGEFLNAAQAQRVIDLAKREEDFCYAEVDDLGSYTEDDSFDQKHIDLVKALELVDVEAIRNAHFKVAIDTVNSVGGIILPKLLEQLGVETVTGLFTEANGDFQHNPEPLEKNLGDMKALMKKGGHDIGFVVDPDVDRLALFCENGEMYGEEYTLVTVADYILSQTPGGNTVSNLSSTRALRDVTEKHGGHYCASAVGEVNVVTKMKAVGAVIGGEGNGGVIYPAAHYGRDALVGIALILTYLAKKKCTTSQLRATLPNYVISKNRIDLDPKTDVDGLLLKMKEAHKNDTVTDIDGVKIDYPDRWVHLRKSNTEPIIRVYAEAPTLAEADALAGQIIAEAQSLI